MHPRLQSRSTRMHMYAHVCTLMHMYVHAQPGLQPQSARMDANEHARTWMYTYTHTEDHFPLSRLKLHPPQHTGPCHRGHTGDTRGTCWGRTGDTWGTCLSAELRSGTHKHTRGEIPLHPASCKHQGAPGPGARVTLVWHWGSPSAVLAVPWVTSSLASSCAHPCVHMCDCCSDTGRLWLSSYVIVHIHTCGSCHLQGW